MYQQSLPNSSHACQHHLKVMHSSPNRALTLKRELIHFQMRFETSLFRNTAVICLLMINTVQTLACAHTLIHTLVCSLKTLAILPYLGESQPKSTLLRMTAALILQRDASRGLGLRPSQDHKGHLYNEQGMGFHVFQGPLQP